MIAGVVSRVLFCLHDAYEFSQNGEAASKRYVYLASTQANPFSLFALPSWLLASLWQRLPESNFIVQFCLFGGKGGERTVRIGHCVSIRSH